jgi:hypothetical protein
MPNATIEATAGWPPPWILKPADGQPHDAEDDGYEGVGWDLSFGCRLNAGHADFEDVTTPLTIGAHFSDADRARGFVEREVSPAQLVEFARLLLNLAAKHTQRQTAEADEGKGGTEGTDADEGVRRCILRDANRRGCVLPRRHDGGCDFGAGKPAQHNTQEG